MDFFVLAGAAAPGDAALPGLRSAGAEPLFSFSVHLDPLSVRSRETGLDARLQPLNRERPVAVLGASRAPAPRTADALTETCFHSAALCECSTFASHAPFPTISFFFF